MTWDDILEFGMLFIGAVGGTAFAGAVLAFYASLMGADFWFAFWRTFLPLLATTCFVMAYFRK